MNKDFVPYKEALALRDLGYKGDIIGMYDEDKDLFTLHEQDDIEDEWLPAPLYQQAFRWFREKYDIISVIYRVGDDYVFGFDTTGAFNNNPTYEEAELACLTKLIEIVELNQNKDETDSSRNFI